MLLKRDNCVSELWGPVGTSYFTRPSDASTVQQKLSKANRGDINFDMKCDTAERLTDPFEKLHKPANALLAKQKKHLGRHTWDSLVFSSFSPKYMASIEKVQLGHKKSAVVHEKNDNVHKNPDVDNDENIKSFQEHVDGLLKNECLAIERDVMPSILFKTGFKKPQKNKINLNKEITTLNKGKSENLATKNQTKSGNPIHSEIKTDFYISPPNCHIFEEDSCLGNIDQFNRHLAWDELDRMKIKCTNWLTDNMTCTCNVDNSRNK